MKLRILTVGKPKEKRLSELAMEYIERIRPAGLVGVERVPDAASRSPREAMEREGQELIKRLSARDRVILLREDGEERDSRSFAALLSSEMERTSGRVTLIIGGPWGAGDAVKERADIDLSLSRMTFTHEMCFLFLAEQIYRAFSIMNGSGYHH